VAQKLARTLGVSVDYLIGMYDDDRYTRAQRTPRRKKPREPALPEGAAPHRLRPREVQQLVARDYRQWELDERRRRIRERLRQRELDKQLPVDKWMWRLVEERPQQMEEGQLSLEEFEQQMEELRLRLDELRLVEERLRLEDRVLREVRQQQMDEWRTAPHQMQLPLGRAVSPALTAQAIVEAMGSEYAVRLAHDLIARAQGSPEPQYTSQAGTTKDEESEHMAAVEALV
jgi:hypothetical protein